MEEFSKQINVHTFQFIHSQDAIKISLKDPAQEITSYSELPMHMLNKIMMLDSTYRLFPQSLNRPTFHQKNIGIMELMKLKSQNKINDVGNPIHLMDVFLFLFIHCDPIFRQIFITQVSKCQHSLPLITTYPFTQKLTFYPFALKSLYKDYITTDKVGKSFSVTEEKLPIISFIRIGECGKSQKSQMINMIIGINDYFFHRDLLGNSKNRYFLDGTVEIGWKLDGFYSKNRECDQFTGPYMVLNLRGNAWKYQKQRNFISSISTLIYLFIPLNQCDKEMSDCISNFNKEFSSKLVFVTYIGDNPLVSEINLTSPDFFHGESETLLFLHKNSLGEDSKIIVDNISSRVQDVSPLLISLEDCISIARQHSIFTDMDEENIGYCQNVVDKIIQQMMQALPNDSKSLALVKKSMLPLQGKCWSQWADAKRESYKVGLQEKSDKVNTLMAQAREQQLELLRKPTSLLVNIINHCKSFGDPHNSFYIIWNLLRNDFNSLSRKFLPPLYDEYKKWHKRSNATHLDTNSSAEESKKLQQECKSNLILAAKNIAESSFGIEHIFRELGQLFEAHYFSKEQKCTINQSLDFEVDILKNIAAKLLIQGHAFEIIDGDVNHIAIKWVTSVLKSLAYTIGRDKKIFVLSILGTQSTGKSTLLNTMFGANFPVSSGRCTRGIFMQLIPIEKELQSKLKYNYLVIVDTEGLRAPELSINSSYKRDNELATIAVGLGDVTVFNMYGEGHSDVQDILQIIIFAFIRMKETYSKPRCMFVHQNVPDTHVHNNLLTARANLIKTLDTMTICAAQQENKKPFYTKFIDVIEFHSDNEVFYFPGLFEGEAPLNRISSGYCKKAEELRRYLLNCFATSTGKTFQTVLQWSDKLESLWKSVLEENFVFSYKNALEVTSRFELDHQVSSWHSSYIQSLNKMKSISLNQLFNADFQEIDIVSEELMSSLQQERMTPSIEFSSQKQLINSFFVEHEKVEIFSQWQANTVIHFEDKRNKHLNSIEKEYTMIYNLQKTKKKIDETFVSYRKEILSEVQNLFTEMNKKGISLNYKAVVDSKFKIIWEEWRSKIHVEKTQVSNICKDLRSALLESYIIKSMHVLSDKSMLINDITKFVAIGKENFQSLSHFQSKNNPKSFYFILHDLFKRIFSVGYIVQIFGHKPKDAGTSQFANVLSIMNVECERNIHEYLSSMLKNGISYDSNTFHIVIDICYQIAHKHNLSQNNNTQQSLELTTDFIFDLIFYHCCKAIPTLQTIDDNFLSRTSLDLKFQQLKDTLEATFKQLCEGIQAEYLCARELALITLKGLEDSLADSVSQVFLEIFLKESKNIPTYENRSSLILRILKNLARDKNFDDYISYIQNPINYIVFFVQKQLKECRESKIVLGIIKHLMFNNMKSLVDFCILQCSRACKFRTNLKSSLKWFQYKSAFYSNIKHKIRNVSFNDLDILDIHTVSDYSQFCEFYSQELRKLTNELEWFEWITSILEQDVSLYKNITEPLLECVELCPFCNELCQLSCGEHEHYCGTFHRPKGVSGCRSRESREISLTDCTAGIRDKRSFWYNDKRYEYTNYRSVNSRFSSWKILGEDALDSKYWQWVLSQFEEKFVNYYNIEKNLRILHWNYLTEEMVIEDLESHYRNINFRKD